MKAVACSLLIPRLFGLHFSTGSAGDQQLSGISAAPAHKARRRTLAVLLGTSLLTSVGCYSCVQQGSHVKCKPFGILSLERSYISTSLCSLVFQSKASWANSGIARWLHSVTEEDLGERGSVLVRPAHGLGKARGMRSMSHLLLHRQGDCSQCKLYHSPPVPGSRVLP